MPKRSPNYSPSRHGTGWGSGQPSNAIVAFLDNPNVSDEQRLQVFADAGVTPPASMGGREITATPTTLTTQRGVSRITLKLINWTVGITPEFYRRVRSTTDPTLRAIYDQPTPSITTRPAPTVDNSIVSEFTPTTTEDDYEGVFGVRDV